MELFSVKANILVKFVLSTISHLLRFSDRMILVLVRPSRLEEFCRTYNLSTGLSSSNPLSCRRLVLVPILHTGHICSEQRAPYRNLCPLMRWEQSLF